MLTTHTSTQFINDELGLSISLNAHKQFFILGNLQVYEHREAIVFFLMESNKIQWIPLFDVPNF